MCIFKEPILYKLLSIWKVESSLEQVWNKIIDVQNWHSWWDHVFVHVIDHAVGNAYPIGMVFESSWQGNLPYTLDFKSELTNLIPLKSIEVKSWGDLEGKGKWSFVEQDKQTTVLYEWEVCTTLTWMNLISPWAKSLFEYNHNIIMDQGAKGLCKSLNSNLIVAKNIFI